MKTIKPMKKSFIFILFVLLGISIIRGIYNPKPSTKPTNKDLSKTNLTDFNLEICSFKKFLKENNIDMNIDVPNQYETVQPNNKYSNHYFNLTTDFPDHWEHDRGVSEYSIFRTVNPDSAISLALMATPINCDKTLPNDSFKSFQESPLKTFNDAYGGDYKGYLLKQLRLISTEKITQLEIREKKIRNVNFLITYYASTEVYEGIEVEFMSTSYQTVLWGTLYTFTYHVPLIFFDPSLFSTVLAATNFINPQLSN